MSEGKQKDSRIDKIDLTSMGWVNVLDKDGNLIDELCGAWTTKLAVHLEAIAPKGTKFKKWRELPFSDHLFEADTMRLLEMIISPGHYILTKNKGFKDWQFIDEKRDEFFVKLLDYWKNNEQTR